MELFSISDWLILFCYLLLLGRVGWASSRYPYGSIRHYYLGDHRAPTWAVAISIVATAESAATFLGVPQQSYGGNITYLSVIMGNLLGALFISKVLIPRYYSQKVTTVYQLLESRFGSSARQQVAFMFILGRLFSSGARLYIAALAITLVLFSEINTANIIFSVIILTLAGSANIVRGGIKAVIWTDLLQCFIYIGAAITVAILLASHLPFDWSQALRLLEHPAGQASSKLLWLDTSFNFSSHHPFTLWSALFGIPLLFIAAFGMDQDLAQRLLCCKDHHHGRNAIFLSILISIPITILFLAIGLLLYLFYHSAPTHTVTTGQFGFQGQSVTVLMYFILTELPSGIRGLLTVGIIAAALSSFNSVLNAMSAVIIEDLYRPRISHKLKSEKKLIRAGHIASLMSAILLGLMAIACFFWQQASSMSLLEFALSVMSFAYSGLLGVYFTALFTQRGNKWSVLMALVAGFTTLIFLQHAVWQSFWQEFHPAWADIHMAFPWQLVIGTGTAFCVCAMGSNRDVL